MGLWTLAVLSAFIISTLSQSRKSFFVKNSIIVLGDKANAQVLMGPQLTLAPGAVLHKDEIFSHDVDNARERFVERCLCVFTPSHIP
jgi:hypothetical protein